MKSNAIIRIIIWSIVTAALVGMLVLGLFPWLIRDSVFNDHPPAETAIPVPLATTPGQILPNNETLTQPADTIREIEINWVAGDIIIMATDVTEITISESDTTDEQYPMVFQTKGNELEIKYCEDRLMSGIGISFAADFSKDLYIEVPKSWNGHSIEINAADANVEMHNITLQELDIDGASGTCDFQNCTIGDLDIDAASGSIYYLGTLDKLDLDGASVSFTGDLQNTPNRMDVDSMDGKLDIALPEDCGFTVTMEGLSSRMSSEFYGTSMKNGSHVYGDGRCRINVDGMNCDVTIRKLDTILLSAAETTPAAIDPTTETVPPCTGPNCGDPDCPEHHGSADCTDPTCPRHHAVSQGHHEEPHSNHH